MDLVVGNYGRFQTGGGIDSRLYLFKNIGTRSAPQFQLVDDNWLNFSSLSSMDVYNFAPTFGDLDQDGDMDLMVGSNDGHLYYVRNNGGAGQPLQMAAPIPYYKNITCHTDCTPQLIDLDRDGLTDIIAGGRNGFIRFFKNIGTRGQPDFNAVATISQLGGVDTRGTQAIGFTAPFFVDFGNHFKLICGTEFGKIKSYQNIITPLVGNYVENNPDFGQVEQGFQPHPILYDWNGDGKMELLVGNLRGGLAFFNSPYNTDGSVPVETVLEDIEFKLYPNPVDNQLIIETILENYQLIIYNALGQKVLISDRKVVDIEALPKGWYLAVVGQKRVPFVKK
jgi:FG-GAP-like repeat/Secretion system C-terminal sorting domain